MTEGKTSKWTERDLNLEYLHSNVTPHFVTERHLDNLSWTISLQRVKADLITPLCRFQNPAASRKAGYDNGQSCVISNSSCLMYRGINRHKYLNRRLKSLIWGKAPCLMNSGYSKDLFSGSSRSPISLGRCLGPFFFRGEGVLRSYLGLGLGFRIEHEDGNSRALEQVKGWMKVKDFGVRGTNLVHFLAMMYFCKRYRWMTSCKISYPVLFNDFSRSSYESRNPL